MCIYIYTIKGLTFWKYLFFNVKCEATLLELCFDLFFHLRFLNPRVSFQLERMSRHFFCFFKVNYKIAGKVSLRFSCCILGLSASLGSDQASIFSLLVQRVVALA